MKKQSLTLLLAALLSSGSAMADAGYFDVIYSPQTGEMTKTIGFGIYALNDNGVGGYRALENTIESRFDMVNFWENILQSTTVRERLKELEK